MSITNIEIINWQFKLLDIDSCNMLGSFLNRTGIKVILSQTVNPSFDNKNFGGRSYDITEIEHPLHFIFEYLINCLYYYHNEGKISNLNQLIELPKELDEWNETLNYNLQKLYHFAVGLQCETQCLPFTNQNILISLVLTYNEINQIEKSGEDFMDDDHFDILCQMCRLFVLKILKELLLLPAVQYDSHDILLKECKICGINSAKTDNGSGTVNNDESQTEEEEIVDSDKFSGDVLD